MGVVNFYPITIIRDILNLGIFSVLVICIFDTLEVTWWMLGYNVIFIS